MSVGTAVDAVELMNLRDFTSPAELFVSRRAGTKRGGLGYHRFATAEQAIEYAVENFSALRPDDLVMTVDDKRFNLAALKTLHRDAKRRTTPPTGGNG